VEGVTKKWALLGRLGHPAIAVLATLAVFFLPLVRSPGAGLSAALASLLGLLVLLGAVARARARALARDPQPERQRSWPPGVLFGLGAAAGGLFWAPLPVLGERAGARAHWAAPVALAFVAIPLLLLAVWTDVPLARTLAAAALIMAASALTPVKPVDGGALAAAGGTAAGLAGVGLAALLLLGLV
jgi:hypothetical protein